MIEVFRTNINNHQEANKLKEYINTQLPNCLVSFDLDDCDRILRVCSTQGAIEVERIIGIVSESGYKVEMLE